MHRKLEAHSRATPPTKPNRTIPEEFEAISRAVIAADEAYLQEAIQSVDWNRRGLLQRLTRADRPPGER
jgi:hypothetical protein